MKKDIHDLILSISDSLKEYAEGNRPFDEAKSGYRDLLERYERLESGLRGESGDNFLSGLCYHHNVENFSILSGIYHREGEVMRSVAFHGEEKINARLLSILGKRDPSFFAERATLPPGRDGWAYSIHTTPLAGEDHDRLVFAAISSSTYFREDRFHLLGGLLSELFQRVRTYTDPPILNHFAEATERVNRFLRENIDDSHSVHASFYVFTLLEKMFSHMGRVTLFGIAGGIIETITGSFGPGALVIPLSLREYIVLSRQAKGDPTAQSAKKLEFFYNKISIPFNHLRLTLETDLSAYNLWEQVFTFEHYLLTGDKMK